MNKFKIGLIKEGKTPPDKRVALSPDKCRELLDTYNNLEIFVQPSEVRAFSDNEYKEKGITLKEDLSDCDLLLGIKEVPVSQLIPEKTYMFFSHTIKLQPYNKKLLKELIAKKIKLVDYEVITDSKSRRLIGFGKYAGIVGTYNAFLSTGQKLGLYDLKPANKCYDKEEMEKELSKIKLPKDFKIIITGDGKVFSGCLEILSKLPLKRVSQDEFLNIQFDEPVYTLLKSVDLYKNIKGIPWDTQYFYTHPEEYTAIFTPYTKKADLYIACHYWNSKSDVFFTKQDMKDKDFKIQIIADISCDINGPIPSTIRPSTIDEPVYGYDKLNDVECSYKDKNAIMVMAVDNLPCELSRSASEDFSNQFISNVLPCLLGEDKENIIERGTITENGILKENYQYLSSMLE
ncbi:MAG: NAD(P)-dependent oxidoreductase [Cyanobacteriota bacterium]